MSKEERKDAITAKKIETKKTVRKAARQVKEAVTSPVEKAATGVKFAAQEAKMIREIEKGKGTQFDPKFADIMIQMIDEDKEYKMREQ